MPKAKRMTDEELAQRAWNYKVHKAHAVAEEELANGERDLIVTELRARKKMGTTVTFPDAGLTIKGKESKRLLSLDRAKTILSRGVLRKVTKTVIVAAQWQAAMAAGELTTIDDEHCRVDTPCEPHIYVNEIKADGGAKAA